MAEYSDSFDETTLITISIVIVIVAVVALENIFHLLHLLTKDSAFNEMIVRIEKELMIVGSTAFIFRIVGSSAGRWDEALNFADLLIPIFSFCYCAVGCILIISSLQQCSLWSRACYVQLIELLDEFLENSRLLSFRLSWKPMHPIIAKIEFRIFHSIFCDFFLLKPSSFAFDEYVARVYEKFVFRIVSIGYSHWSALAALVLLNWARVAGKVDFQMCESGDSACEEMSNIVLFTILGAFLFIVTVILVYESRNLELRIMAKRNVVSYLSYDPFLRAAGDESKDRRDNELMDETMLRNLAHEEKNRASTERLAKENNFGYT